MTRRLITLGCIGASFALSVSAAWAATGPSRDDGDATAARVGLTVPVTVVRDHGDAADAKLALKSGSILIVRDAGDARPL